MQTRVSERVSVRILRPDSEANELSPVLDLTARRFMGTLMHPVPRSEMAHKWGIDKRACKIVTDWTRDVPDDAPVRPGDIAQIQDRDYLVLAANAVGGCYVEMYVDERPCAVSVTDRSSG